MAILIDEGEFNLTSIRL